jgi:hypothetical protein
MFVSQGGIHLSIHLGGSSYSLRIVVLLLFRRGELNVSVDPVTKGANHRNDRGGGEREMVAKSGYEKEEPIVL